MKKLAKLTVLLLAGTLLLVLTACGAAPGGSASMTPEEIAAKQRLLDEINNYRASLDPSLAPLVEVKQLSDAEQAFIEPFRAAGKTELPLSERDEATKLWSSMTAGRTPCGGFGLVLKRKGDHPPFEFFHFLSAKVPANTPEGKAELLAALRDPDFHAFDCQNCKNIGIAVVTIDGQMYWNCTVYN